ncbi:unnamed protein product [Dovyalis caffra]|uniref:Uncharacterized protein n=1 Tax=Dovyalis caffra TaxID=77055 RepID=A0AAV1QNZ9_9ROSI|nr:unnamed protein product [Dovyalis caffra]
MDWKTHGLKTRLQGNKSSLFKRAKAPGLILFVAPVQTTCSQLVGSATSYMLIILD